MDYSAGIVLIRMIDEIPHMLCLRIYHSYDLPKGKIENSESAFEAARRETFEEAGIDEITFPWGDKSIELHKGKKKKLTLFIGQTAQEPSLRPNPVTGKFEHHSIKWLSLDDAENALHDYLRPVVEWIRKVLGGMKT